MSKKFKIEFVSGLLILLISTICIFYYSNKVNIFNKVDKLYINSSFFDIGNINIFN